MLDAPEPPIMKILNDYVVSPILSFASQSSRTREAYELGISLSEHAHYDIGQHCRDFEIKTSDNKAQHCQWRNDIHGQSPLIEWNDRRS